MSTRCGIISFGSAWRATGAPVWMVSDPAFDSDPSPHPAGPKSHLRVREFGSIASDLVGALAADPEHFGDL